MSVQQKELFFSPALDFKYVLTAVNKLAKHRSTLRRIVGGANSWNALLRDLYGKHPVGVVSTHDFEIFLDPCDMGVSPSIGVLGWHELKTSELFFKLVEPGSTVIDVGANVGYFTLLAAKLAGKEGLVLAFEPDPTSFGFLSKSIAKNNFQNVRIFRECISNIDGQRTLYLSATSNRGLHSTSTDLGGVKITVPSARLDSVASMLNVSSVDLLKVDVEGGEPDVLESASHLLAEGRVKNIIMEWDHREPWMGRTDLLRTIFERFEVYRFARSIPFLPANKLTPGSSNMFGGRVGTNVYLRQRANLQLSGKETFESKR